MSAKDYRKLYRNQDSVLAALKPVQAGFYLTGGTALGRFYLHHRFSEDLDFFSNADPDFKQKTAIIGKKLRDAFTVLPDLTVIYADYVKFVVSFGESRLKIEYINDVPYRCGQPLPYLYGLIDTPLNILSNKISALIARDEPKDIFDVYTLARTYAFNWMSVFGEAKKKAMLNEIDVEQRIKSFPVEMMGQMNWIVEPFAIDTFRSDMLALSNDFILGRNNSLAPGMNALPIENAVPGIFG